MTAKALTTANLYLLLASPVILGLGGIAIGYGLNPSLSSFNPSSSLAEHYSRIVAPHIAQQNVLELSRLMASMVEDKRVVQASLYTLDGQRLVQQGLHELLPAMLKEQPQWQSKMVAVEYQAETIGYLQWVETAIIDK